MQVLRHREEHVFNVAVSHSKGFALHGYFWNLALCDAYMRHVAAEEKVDGCFSIPLHPFCTRKLPVFIGQVAIYLCFSSDADVLPVKGTSPLHAFPIGEGDGADITVVQTNGCRAR